MQQVLDTDEWAAWLGVWRRVTVDGPWPEMTADEEEVFRKAGEDEEASQLLARWLGRPYAHGCNATREN